MPTRLSILLVLTLTACTGAAPPTPATPKAPVSQPSTANAPPLEQLNALDKRTPVPLQPIMAWHQKENMMEHLVAIQRINGALAEEDWEGVAKASALLESSPEMKQMCTHMGAGAPGFTELALEFHRRADAIGVAARAKDGPGVLRATSNTLEACTACHASYKQEIVDAATWEARAGYGPSSGPASQPSSE